MDFEHSKGTLFDALLGESFEVYSSKSDNEPQVVYASPYEEISQTNLPLFEEEDRDILMHRDAHFAGNFELMADYYEKEGKGAVLDIDPERIYELGALEKQLARDLAPFVLQGADAEKIAKSKAFYKALQMQYDDPKAKQELIAIADLIFSEEEEPENDAEKIFLLGEKMIPHLILLIQTEELYDPLFPGYGRGPIAAALALGKFKAEEAIQPLFCQLAKHDFDIESASLSALASIGEKALQFCLRILASRPLTLDNERAAIAICAFEHHEALDQAILLQLQDTEVQKKEPLITYLILACENLSSNHRAELQTIAKTAKLPKSAQEELLMILKMDKKI